MTPHWSRTMYAVWDLLSPEERAAIRRYGGLPDDWEPKSGRPPTEEEQLEGIDELAQLMPLPPRFESLADWKRAVKGRIGRRRGAS